MNGKQEMQVHKFYCVQKTKTMFISAFNFFNSPLLNTLPPLISNIFFSFGLLQKNERFNRGEIPEKRRNSNKYKTLIKQQ